MSLYTVRCHPLKIMYILFIYAEQDKGSIQKRGGGVGGKTVVTEPKP